MEVKQTERKFYISQKAYAKKVLETFKMEDCNLVSTPIPCGTNLSKNYGSKIVNQYLYRSIVGNLRYLTCTRPNIYGVGVFRHYMEAPNMLNMKMANRILRYIY